MKRIYIIATLVVGMLGLVGCSSDETLPTGPASTQGITDLANGDLNLVETAEANGNFPTLLLALEKAMLVDAIANGGPFTVFAPSEEAFAKLPEGLLAELIKPENKDKLVELLQYHVIPGAVTSNDLRFWQRVETLQGDDLTIFKRGQARITVNRDSEVILKDVMASNGVIHVIDCVLIPEGFTLDPDPTLNIAETAAASNAFPTLLLALEKAMLVDAIANGGPFTVFAPSEAAFAKLPEGVLADLTKPENKDKLVQLLKYHVVPGNITSGDLNWWQRVETLEGSNLNIFKTWKGEILINRESKVETPDILATNGVIHVIDCVLVPRGFFDDDENDD